MLKFSLFLHIVAALFWIGGMLFLTLIIAPFLKTIQDVKERARIYQSVGKGFRFWGWIAISILVITGPLNLHLMGIQWSNLVDTSFYRNSYGRTLAIKISFVILIISTSLLHDFVFGPKARNSPGYGMLAKWLGRSNLFIALAIVFFAVILRLGGF